VLTRDHSFICHPHAIHKWNEWLLNNSRICHLAYWTSCRVGSSRTSQVTDSTTRVLVNWWKLSLTENDSMFCWLGLFFIIIIINFTCTGQRSKIYVVLDRVGSLQVGISASCPVTEWTIPAFTPQPQSVTALWPVLIFRSSEGRRPSWTEVSVPVLILSCIDVFTRP